MINQNSKINIDFHADDYALSINTSKKILECIKDRCLDSISIVPNMNCYDDCMDMLYKEIPNISVLPLMSIHIDLIEGNSLSHSLPQMTWKSLFLSSYNPIIYKKIKNLIKSEIQCQIDTAWNSIQKCITIAQNNNVPVAQKHIRIDSHQHTHMIPIVWQALMEVINEENYPIEFIRNSKEPILPFLKAFSLLNTYRPINFLKNILLNVYSIKVSRYNIQNNLANMNIWGLIMSGHMDYSRINQLYPILTKYVEKKQRDLEILFHPGLLLQEELTVEIPIDSAKSFYFDKGRQIEYDALHMLKNKKQH